MHLRSYVTKIPITILERYKLVTLTGDIMFVNGIRFMITKSRHIKFTTIQFIPSAKENNLFESILETKQIYRRRGFDVNIILMDGQFECIRTQPSGAQITLNVCANNEHVHEVERMIRVVKERTRGVHATMPFNKMPGRMIIELVCAAVFWLNCFYLSASICGNLSPRTIMTGQTIDFNRHVKHEFNAAAYHWCDCT